MFLSCVVAKFSFRYFYRFRQKKIQDEVCIYCSTHSAEVAAVLANVELNIQIYSVQ